MEGTLGHLLGFFYLFLLMGQMSLARTTWHTKIGWLTFLEVFVAIHGAIVAIDSANGMWPMFFFGFMMMFILTQMFGLIKSWLAAAGVFVSYATLVAIAYGGALQNWLSGTSVGWSDIHQVTWIPVILYGLVFVLAWVFAGVYALIKKAKKS